MMELEKPKAIYREEEFKGSLFEKPVRELVPGMKARARREKGKALVQDVLNLLTAVVAVTLFGRLLGETTSLLGRAGLVAMMLGMAAIVAEIFLHRIRSRRPTDLTLNEYYRSECRKTEATIRMRRRIWAWGAIFAVVGFLPFFFSTYPSPKEIASFSAFLAAMIGVSRWIVERRIRKGLEPLKEELTRIIEKFDEDPGQSDYGDTETP
jgi:hypothetical protein